MNRIKWDCIYPNPTEISRNKYYEYEIKDNTAFVYGDGLVLDYTVEQLKEFFTLESGTWEDIFKKEIEEFYD